MRYQAIIIGAGQAGVPLARALTGKGWTVALAEGGLIGGSCINYGCTPTKTLIASARAAYVARRAGDFGVQAGPVSVDFAQVMAREVAVVDRMRGNLERRFEGNERLTIYHHDARFEGPQQVRVGDEVIEGERIYINTGARPRVISFPGLDQISYLDNHSILKLRDLPPHLLIVGGGYIGVEYAQAFRRFGSEVTILERGAHLLGREDADISEAVQCILEAEGIHVIANAELLKVEARQGGTLALTVRSNRIQQEVNGSHLFIAAGRVPNSDQLDLDKAGVRTGPHGYIQVNDHLETNVPGIWALGDVNGRGGFTHTSWNDYEIVMDNLNGGQCKVSDRIPTYAVYLDPPLGRVGMSEDEARKSGREVLMGTLPMTDVARAIERDETQGFMKVLVDAQSQQFLGAAILGIGGDEIIHIFTSLMTAQAPYTVLKNMMGIHPTVSELLPTLLDQLQPLPSGE